MEHTLPLSTEAREVLEKARKTYGPTRQILVAIEELGELAKVCAKFPRYDDPASAANKLHADAVDEVADVLIILDHVISIFDLDWQEIIDRIPVKVERVSRWLEESTSMEQTTIDRKLRENPSGCSGCVFEGTNAGHCKTCKDQSGYQAPLPCGSCDHMGDVNNFSRGGPCSICIQTSGSKYKPKAGRK